MQCSIIIPVLNEAESILQTLKPLQLFRSQGHEVILVDGGSQDNTIEIAQPWVDLVLSSEKKGRANQMNAGAAHAGKDVLLFLHADTLLYDEALDTLLLQLATSRRVWGRFDIRLSSSKFIYRVIETMINWRSRVSGVATGDQAIFVKAYEFSYVGRFPDFPLMEDVALSKKLKKISRPICVSTSIMTSSRRWEQFGVIRTILLMWRLRLAYFFGVSPQQLVKYYYG